MSLFEVGFGTWGGARDMPAGRQGRAGGAGGRRGAGVAAFVLAVATAGALVHVAVRIKGLEVAYELGRERRTATEMEEQRRRLQIEIGMLKDPGRVITIAREKLNMAPPPPEAIWRLGSGEPARVEAPAAARLKEAAKESAATAKTRPPARPPAAEGKR